MWYHIIFSLAVFIFFSCEQENPADHAGKAIHFYLLDEYSTPAGRCKIIDSTVVLSDSIIIPYHEILSYNKSTCTFTITEECHEKIGQFNTPVHGVAFAVAIDKNPVYTGYFWASYSSLSCDWLTIDPIDYTRKNQLTLQLGYPGGNPNHEIPDKRNDPALLEIFKRDGKLTGL
jgi:hypothetical protein